MATHSALSHFLPQVIDGFKIEIDSDVVYSEYMNGTNFINTEGNNLLDLKTDTFVVDLNQSLLPSKSDGTPLYCGEEKQISEYTCSNEPFNRPNSVYNSSLRPSHYLHPQESDNKESQSKMIHRAHEGDSNSKPPNSFYTRCKNTVSPDVTLLDNNSFHYSQYSWDIQNSPLDLSIPKSQGDCTKSGKTDTDESTEKEKLDPLCLDPGYQKNAAEDTSVLNTIPAHVVHRPIPTYPRLFHSRSINNSRGTCSNFINDSLPNYSWHDETWSQNLSRDPNLSVQWSCCDKYLSHNSIKDDEKPGADLIGDPVNKSVSNDHPLGYEPNSFSPPSSGLAKTIMQEYSLTCGVANPLHLNRSYHKVAPSVVYQPGLVDSRQQRHQYFPLDATKMSSDMSCRQKIKSHKSAQPQIGPIYHEPAVINLDSEFMDLDHLTFTENKCKLPAPQAVTISNEVSRSAHTQEDVFKERLQNVRNPANRCRGSPSLTPLKRYIKKKSSKDCGNFIIFPPINKTTFRHNWITMDNQDDDLTSMSFKRKRKRTTGTNQVCDENKQPLEQTFNDKCIPKVKRRSQPLAEAFNDKGTPKVKQAKPPPGEAFNDQGTSKVKQAKPSPGEAFNDQGTSKVKQGKPSPGEAFNDQGTSKVKQAKPSPGEAFNDQGTSKVKQAKPSPGEAFNDQGTPKVKQGKPSPGEAFNDQGITEEKRRSQPLAEAFNDKGTPKVKQGKPSPGEAFNDKGTPKVKQGKPSPGEAFNDQGTPKVKQGKPSPGEAFNDKGTPKVKQGKPSPGEAFNDQGTPKVKQGKPSPGEAFNDQGTPKVKQGKPSPGEAFNDQGITEEKRRNQPREEAFEDNVIPKVKVDNQPLEEAYNDDGITKEKRCNQPLEEAYNDDGITKEKRCNQPLEEAYNDDGITKEKRCNQPLEEAYNDDGITKEKRCNQPLKEAYNDDGITKEKRCNQPLEEAFNDDGITKEKRCNQPLEEAFNDDGITKEKRCNQPLEEAFNDNGITKEKRCKQQLEEAFNGNGITKEKQCKQPLEEALYDIGIPKVKLNKQPLEEAFNDNGTTKEKQSNQPLEEAFNGNGITKEKQSNQHLINSSFREESKIENSHPSLHCSSYLPKKGVHDKKEDLADGSEKLSASFECVTCKLQCDSLYFLLEHQQKECQFVRKVYHATDCLGKVKEKDCQCTNCSLCKCIFNSKFRVFSHCLKGCYMRHSYCLENDSFKKLLSATTKVSVCNNKDSNGSEESATFQKRKQKLSEEELNHSMEVLRAKYELWKGLEGKHKHDINTKLEELTEKCEGNKTHGLVTCDVDSKMLLHHSSIEKQTCNEIVKPTPDEIKALSTVDNVQQFKTVSFGKITANNESQIAFKIKEASSKFKHELCKGEALGEIPVSGTSKHGHGQTYNDDMKNTAHRNSLEVNQSIPIRCKSPEISLDKKIIFPEIKIEVDDGQAVASDKYTDGNHFNPTENNQQDTVLQCLDEQKTTNSMRCDRRALPTPAIKMEPTSQDFSWTCESQDKSTQSSPVRPWEVTNKACHTREWSAIQGDHGLSKDGVQEVIPRLSFTSYDSELQIDVKKTKRGRMCKSDVRNYKSVVAGTAKGKRGVARMASGSLQAPSAIAFGASQRINKNGEKEKITYLLDANSKPIMLVEKEHKENSIMKCEKCLQCFPTFLFLTWHAKYTCPFRVTLGRRGRPRKSE